MRIMKELSIINLVNYYIFKMKIKIVIILFLIINLNSFNGLSKIYNINIG